jgi:hypothetical protein
VADDERDALWAYCVLHDGDPVPEGLAGVHGDAPVEAIRAGGLALLCSRVPLQEFGAEPLRRNLNELPWLERVARAHEGVLEAALEHATIVPLRLCTIFADEAAARRMLAERGPALSEALAALDGRDEWSVKLLVDAAALEAAIGGEAEPVTEAGSGAAYLLRRRHERELRQAAGARAAELAEEVHARLREHALDARTLPAQNRELSGHTGEMVLNAAYLVERPEIERLREAVAELQERVLPEGAELRLSGPLPPFNFAGQELPA